ncbi:MAG: tyrosine--tRNA ligase [Gemmatimonadetes bacterium]|nr:tyrosine--tRNA ligase [Gemmatimonadota bacterium]
MTDLLTTLRDRGMLHDATPGLSDRLAKGPITGYVGFDPTADSLHVGNLVPVMGLVWLQRLGGRPIALIGGGTGLVGDPSGKRNERPMLSLETVDANARAIQSQLARFLDFDGPRGARLLNNADWLQRLSLLEFLRDAGKHFTISYMLQKDSVKSRLDAGISFTEFAYMLVQAYDFWHLNRTEACELQMGGSDQWGNITAGIELIGRKEGDQVHGAVMPLLTTASGAKFGKSEGGNVWLDPAKTSPFKFYQFWLNTDDQDVERLLLTFTTLSLDDIGATMAEQRADPGRRAAQRVLARDVTGRVHGEDTALRVIGASEVLFGGRALAETDVETLAVVADEVKTVTVPRTTLAEGLSVVDLLVDTGLAASKAEARRGIQGQGFAVNGAKVASADRSITPADLLGDRFVALQKGKRHYAFVRVA